MEAAWAADPSREDRARLAKLRTISTLAWEALAEFETTTDADDEPRQLPRGSVRGKKRGGRRPDYKLGAMLKNSDRRNNSCGVGWLNEDGSIQVTLDPCVILNGNVTDVVYRLFPVDAGQRRSHTSFAERDEELDDF
jgi:hypothetical protein